jgi:hypothetical protein
MRVFEFCVDRIPGFHPQAHFAVYAFVDKLRIFFRKQKVRNQIQIGRFVNRHRGNLFAKPHEQMPCPIVSLRHFFVGGFCTCVCLFSVVENPDLYKVLQELLVIFQEASLGASRRESLAMVSFVDRHGKLILGPVK